METRVVHCKVEPYDVLIDRSTKWGNPFKIGYDGSGTYWGRDDVIHLYRTWMITNEQDGLMKDLHELEGKVLGCWCKPLPCHGDVLVELLEIERQIDGS